MISKIPTGALILGLSGVIPFGWGAVTLVSEEAFNFGLEYFGARFSNTTLLRYHHPLFHVWRSLGLRHKNGQKKCEHGLYTICHSSLVGIPRNGQRAN